MRLHDHPRHAREPGSTGQQRAVGKEAVVEKVTRLHEGCRGQGPAVVGQGQGDKVRERPLRREPGAGCRSVVLWIRVEDAPPESGQRDAPLENRTREFRFSS